MNEMEYDLLHISKFTIKVKDMLKTKLWMTSLVAFVALAGCAAFDEEVDPSMIPPSANYSPTQTPVYPPLNQPYTPNLLNDDNSRVMNIDRLNVGEANINSPQTPSEQSAFSQNPNVDVYINDNRGDYVPSYVAPIENVPPLQVAEIAPNPPSDTPSVNPPSIPNDNVQMIHNSPILTPSNVIELSAVGMGVAPEYTISPSQALALAKRAAIIDAYRQIGEKMYGIRLNAQDTVRDMVLINSVVKTKVEALIKNAEIIETIYKDGLCQITMELKLDGKVWHKILSDS